jgi:hypothetical protein
LCCPSFLLLLLCIITESGLMICEKTNIHIEIFWDFAGGCCVLQFCFRMSTFESEIFDLSTGLHCPHQLQPTIGRLRCYCIVFIIYFASQSDDVTIKDCLNLTNFCLICAVLLTVNVLGDVCLIMCNKKNAIEPL